PGEAKKDGGRTRLGAFALKGTEHFLDGVLLHALSGSGAENGDLSATGVPRMSRYDPRRADSLPGANVSRQVTYVVRHQLASSLRRTRASKLTASSGVEGRALAQQ